MADVDASMDGQAVVLNKPPQDEPKPSDKDFDFRHPLTRAFGAALGFGLLSEQVAGSYGSIFASVGMLAYFIFGARLPPTARNTERFADSLYYLGFILTLFALLLAMTPALNGGHAPQSDDIIQKFGTAIITTFIGMTLRIILIQLKPNVSDHEEDTRESIANYVKGLNEELTATIKGMVEFRTSVTTTMDETLKSFKSGLQSNSKDSGEALNEASDELLNGVKAATQTLQIAVADIADKLSKMDLPTDYLSVRIGKAGDALSSDIDTLSQRIHSAFTALADTLSHNAASLDQIRVDTGTLQKLLTKVGSTVAKAAEISDQSFANATQRLEQAEQASAGMTVLGRTASELASHLQSLSQAMDQRHRQHGNEVQQLVTELRQSTAEIQESQKLFQNAISESTAVLRDTINDVAKDE